MYRAAVQLARDASVEELLGNLETYVINVLYLFRLSPLSITYFGLSQVLKIMMMIVC